MPLPLQGQGEIVHFVDSELRDVKDCFIAVKRKSNNGPCGPRTFQAAGDAYLALRFSASLLQQ